MFCQQIDLWMYVIPAADLQGRGTGQPAALLHQLGSRPEG